ncbi:MAG: ribonuclease HII [Chloroflexi bacterium]|nr:ribonuclease HII [Chloroflexota bacterium]
MSAENGRARPIAKSQARVPDLRWERAFWAAGLRQVGGVDEVGRGAMAGPLVAAAVVFPASEGWALRRLKSAIDGIRDSKMLSPERRVALLETIERTAVTIGIGIVPVPEIDVLGLGPANRIAMERAVLNLDIDVDALVIDACVLDLGCPQSGLIDGDALSASVAAASIVAKVTRDRMMIALGMEEPRYGFELHKGYCSELHQARLEVHGPCLHHRRCFAPVARWEVNS